MNVDDCYQLGYVAKTHGLKGALQIVLDVDAPNAYSELESLLVAKNELLTPFLISNLSINLRRSIIKLRDVDSIEAAHELIGCKLYLPLKNLPKLKNDQFYFHELEGATIFDKSHGTLGKVINVVQMSKQNILVMGYHEKEVLIPMVEPIFLSFDRKKMCVNTNLPNGLLELYLQ